MKDNMATYLITWKKWTNSCTNTSHQEVNHGNIEYLNRTIMSSETELEIQSLPLKERLNQMASLLILPNN